MLRRQLAPLTTSSTVWLNYTLASLQHKDNIVCTWTQGIKNTIIMSHSTYLHYAVSFHPFCVFGASLHGRRIDFGQLLGVVRVRLHAFAHVLVETLQHSQLLIVARDYLGGGFEQA